MRFAGLLGFLSIAGIAFAATENALKGIPDPSALIIITIAIIALTLAYSSTHKFRESEKKIAFILIAGSVAMSTVYLAAHTVYLNIVSESGGPVHWHADYEVWVCGKKLDLINPKGFEGYVGIPLIHEHNDDRIHIEGVPLYLRNVDLGAYFDAVGGRLSATEMVYPTDKGIVGVNNGDLCNNQPAQLQVFAYKTQGKKYHQEKLSDFVHYILSPYPQVPAGDCIIIEFDKEKLVTDKICETYRIASNKGDIIGG